MKYTVIVDSRVEKQIKKLPKDVQKTILQTFELLAETPRPIKCKKLEGRQSTYRLRLRDVYRIVYEIRDDQLIVLVVKVGHRREVYRG